MPQTFRVVPLCLVLAACVPPPPAPLHYPEISFRDRPPIRLDVTDIEIVDAYVPPLKAPHVEQDSPVLPGVLLRRWAEQRLVAAGGRGRMRATVVDAGIVETLLPINQTVEASVTTEAAARFDGRVEMKIELVDESGATRATAQGEARRSRTLAEDATLREREEVLFQMSEDLANDLDRVLDRAVHDNFGAYLLP